ncbi:hypothetical protein [Frigoribacterium faeni]|jgi:hypothetical protein|uniref:hypothetical protein n=1 Tax=Frigoribacterium faeni TaxID=145483 RepID=UPI00141A9A0B|nr:hypothetical protein [Frigoribacterium faeni]NIJ04277.1 hypothetical protein [Frigoribacterium faeni]
MMTRVPRDDFEVIAVPRHTIARSAVLTGVFSLAPVLVALLWLTWSTGRWPAVLWVADVAVVAGLLMYWRFRVSYAAVTATEFFKRGWLPGTVRLPRDSVATVLVAHTYRGASTETVPQLVALDDDGQVLFRMRGGYWSEEAIAAVTEALGSAVTTVSRPMSAAEFYRTWPESRSWYEGRRWLSTSLVVLAFAAASGVLVLVWRAFTG